MGVILASHAPGDLSGLEGWASPDGCACEGGLAALHVVPAIEDAFPQVIPDYLALCAHLGRTPTAVLSHTTSAAVNASDLMVLMVWTRLVEEWIAAGRHILVLCQDPWLFRHFAAQRGIRVVTPAPALRHRQWTLAVRGAVARVAYAGRRLLAACHPAPRPEQGGAWLLSYAHPSSTAQSDAYFGNLLAEFPRLRRICHVDGKGDLSLSDWGSPLAALSLLWARWRPDLSDQTGRWGWLIRRAAAQEGGTAQGAAIAWQIACQRAWLRDIAPHAVAWPWENHGWERDLCRASRAAGARSIGYQHSTIGRTELNQHSGSNPDGVQSLPDVIACAGRLFRDELVARGVPAERCVIGGALRYAAATKVRHDTAAPLFAALPADRAIAIQVLAAGRAAAHALDHRLLVRPHPVYDIPVPEDDLVSRAAQGLAAQPAVATVIYAATTVGLEAVLTGLPTIRFIPHGCVALDILPNNIVVPATDAEGLAEAIRNAVPPPPLRRDDVFAPVNLDVWRAALELV